MSRITRSTSQALVLLAIALFAVPPSRADEPVHDNYQFCYAVAGGVEVMSPVFHWPVPYGVREGQSSSFANAVYQKYGKGVAQPGCEYFTTAAQAEARRRVIVDTITKNLGPQGVASIDWKPQAAPAPQPKPKPAAPSAPATPQAPKPVVAAAVPPKPPASVKGIFVVCNTNSYQDRARYYNSPIEVTSGDPAAWQASYQKFLQTNFKFGVGVMCSKLPTLAEAQSYFKEITDSARLTTKDMLDRPWPVVVTDWKYP